MGIKIPIKQIGIFLCLMAILMLSLRIVAFFIKLNSTLSDYSWGDIIYQVQTFHNFMSSRAFTSSSYRLGGLAQNNPYAYLPQFAMHVYITPYVLFYGFYSLYPNINGLYVIYIVFIYVGMAYFSWQILKAIASKIALVTFLWAMFFLLTSEFFTLAVYKNNPPLLVGPFILAMYYFLLRERKWAFLLTCILACLISEDVAMMIVTFSIYIFLFEPKWRPYSYYSFGFSVVYLILAIFIIQPAARYLLDTQQSSYLLTRIMHIFETLNFPRFFKDLLPWVLFLPSLAFIYVAIGKTNNINWRRTIGLIFIAPAAKWAIAIGYGGFGPHHLMSLFSFTFLAFLLMTTKVNLNDNYALSSLSRTRIVLLGGILMMYLFPVAVACAKPARIVTHYFLGIQTDAEESTRLSNEDVIKAIRNIPDSRNFVYWTNRNVEGFIANHSDFWRFPYYFDHSDFLVIQKDAKETFFEFDPSSEKELEFALSQGKEYSSGDMAIISQEAIDRILEELVNTRKTHLIVFEDRFVLILERIERSEIILPPSLVGFGWLDNIPKLFGR